VIVQDKTWDLIKGKFDNQELILIKMATVDWVKKPPAFILDLNQLNENLLIKLVKCLEDIRFKQQEELNDNTSPIQDKL
jgi:hypothetical protein